MWLPLWCFDVCFLDAPFIFVMLPFCKYDSSF